MKFINKILLGSVLVSLCFSVQGQIKFFLEDNNGSDSVEVAVRVKNFEDIIAIQFGVAYDTSHLEYAGLSNLATEIFVANGNFGTPPQTEVGQIRFSWDDLQSVGQSLCNGDTLFTLLFDAKNKGQSNIELSSFGPFQMEVFSTGGQLTIESQTSSFDSNGGILTGQVYFDEDQSCDPGMNESGMPYWLIKATDGNKEYFTSTDKNGIYRVFLPESDYTIEALAPTTEWSFCANSSPVNVEFGPDADLDFGALSDSSCAAIDIDLGVSSLFQCEPNLYSIRYINKGTAETNCTLTVELDEDIILDSQSLSILSQNGNIVEFDGGLLAPGEIGNLYMQTSFDCNMVTPSKTHCVFALGSPFDCSPDSTFYDVDCKSNNNNISFNLLRAFQDGYRVFDYVYPKREVQYMVRFQNREDIEVCDLVVKFEVPEEMDLSSLRAGAASHPYNFSLSPDRIASFHFSQIMLLPENQGITGSTGFVNLNMRINEDVLDGTNITMSGEMIFDLDKTQNSNSVTLMVMGGSSSIKSLMTTSLDLFPNPASKILHVKGFETYRLNGAEYFIHAMDGKICSRGIFKSNDINTAGLRSGFYILSIIDKDDKPYTSRFTIQEP